MNPGSRRSPRATPAKSTRSPTAARIADRHFLPVRRSRMKISGPFRNRCASRIFRVSANSLALTVKVDSLAACVMVSRPE
jgi:hypothetical protein